MPWTVEQVVAEQGTNVSHHSRGTDRVQPMAAEINRDAVENETARIAAHAHASLKYGDVAPSALCELEGGGQARRPGTKHHKRGLRRRGHHVFFSGAEDGGGMAVGRRRHCVTSRPANPLAASTACHRMPEARTASLAAP